MFESIVVRTATSDNRQLDVGLLAEVILFYGQVHLLIDRGLLAALAHRIGPENILRLLRSGYVRATFIRNIPGIVSEGPPFQRVHTSTQVNVGPNDKQRRWNAEDEVRSVLERMEVRPAVAKRFARQFLTAAPIGQLNDGTPRGIDFPSMFVDEMRTRPDVLDQARMVLQDYLPGQLHITRFRLHEERRPGYFYVDADIDWKAAEAEYKRLRPGEDVNLGPENVLAKIQAGFVDLGLAARFGTELLTSEMSEKLVIDRVKQMMQARKKSADEIAAFSQRILGEAVAVREAINSGQQTFSDFLNVMDRARKFKEMLRGANPDIGLLNTYINETKKDSWLEKLAPKSVRFGFFSAAGIGADMLLPTGIGTLTGLAVGALDTFVLDKLARGWRPNTFVEDELQPFLSQQPKEPQ